MDLVQITRRVVCASLIVLLAKSAAHADPVNGIQSNWPGAQPVINILDPGSTPRNFPNTGPYDKRLNSYTLDLRTRISQSYQARRLSESQYSLLNSQLDGLEKLRWQYRFNQLGSFENNKLMKVLVAIDHDLVADIRQNDYAFSHAPQVPSNNATSTKQVSVSGTMGGASTPGNFHEKGGLVPFSQNLNSPSNVLINPRRTNPATWTNENAESKEPYYRDHPRRNARNDNFTDNANHLNDRMKSRDYSDKETANFEQARRAAGQNEAAMREHAARAAAQNEAAMREHDARAAVQREAAMREHDAREAAQNEAARRDQAARDRSRGSNRDRSGDKSSNESDKKSSNDPDREHERDRDAPRQNPEHRGRFH